ncbi:MAG: DUF2764 family protein [Treponemataceae bacterium]|nr:MAG: DUF2764 family protein [Treponemataceae bacterium]
MANWYYLISQLPSFQIAGNSQLPITESAFNELCSRYLDAKTLALVLNLSLEPPRALIEVKTGFGAVDAWNEMEVSLRLALAQLRAQKLQKDFSHPAVSIRPEALQAARTASSIESPLEAELFLNDFRAGFIDKIALADVFSTNALLVYALRLKLAVRIRKFNEEAGRDSYREIYDKILGEAT